MQSVACIVAERRWHSEFITGDNVFSLNHSHSAFQSISDECKNWLFFSPVSELLFQNFIALNVQKIFRPSELLWALSYFTCVLLILSVSPCRVSSKRFFLYHASLKCRLIKPSTRQSHCFHPNKVSLFSLARTVASVSCSTSSFPARPFCSRRCNSIRSRSYSSNAGSVDKWCDSSSVSHVVFIKKLQSTANAGVRRRKTSSRLSSLSLRTPFVS